MNIKTGDTIFSVSYLLPLDNEILKGINNIKIEVSRNVSVEKAGPKTFIAHTERVSSMRISQDSIGEFQRINHYRLLFTVFFTDESDIEKHIETAKLKIQKFLDKKKEDAISRLASLNKAIDELNELTIVKEVS